MNIEQFLVYFEIGYRHILDIRGYDHILFVMVLCAIYRISQWKQIFWIISAFTLGHTVTLLIASFGLLTYNQGFIEIAILASILIIAFSNLFVERKTTIYKDLPNSNIFFRYGMGFVFGLVHGLGFFSYLNALLSPSQSVLPPLFAFNVGLEVGQLLIVSIIMLAQGLGSSVLHIKAREWNIGLSMLAVGMVINMIIGRYYA